METSTDTAAPGATEGRRIQAVVAISVVTVTSAVSGLNVALPAVAEDTGATQSELVWIVDAYTVTLAGLLLSAGALGDRFGRKLILTIGLVTFGGAALVAGFVTDPTALMACRAVMGAGAAFVLPSTLSIITTVLPTGERAAAVGLWVGLAGAGAVVGLFGSAILLEFFWWGSVFVLSAVLAAVALIGALVVLPATKADDPPPLDLLGAGLSLGGIGLLVFGIIEGPDDGWSDPVVLAALIGGVVLLAALVVHEMRTPAPMIDPRLFANRGAQTGSLSISVLFFTFFGFIFLVTQYLQFVAGLSTIEVALALVPFAVVMVPMSRFSPRLAATHGPNRLITLGFVLLACGFAMTRSHWARCVLTTSAPTRSASIAGPARTGGSSPTTRKRGSGGRVAGDAVRLLASRCSAAENQKRRSCSISRIGIEFVPHSVPAGEQLPASANASSILRRELCRHGERIVYEREEEHEVEPLCVRRIVDAYGERFGDDRSEQ